MFAAKGYQYAAVSKLQTQSRGKILEGRVSREESSQQEVVPVVPVVLVVLVVLFPAVLPAHAMVASL